MTPAARAGAAPPPAARWVDRARDYYRLTKPDIVYLILLTTAAGLLLAAEGAPDPWRFAATLGGVGLACAGGGVLNCYVDRDIDAAMRRTARRALPSGRIAPRRALVFGLALAVAGFALMAVATPWQAAVLTAAGFVIYVGVYTLWLKRRTPHNIVIGGAAGAMGPLIGWAATGRPLDWAPWLLFAVIFLWTPPHFWSLALLTQEDYRRAGVPMLPVVAGERHTRLQVLLYTAGMVGVTLAPPLVHLGGRAYAAVAAVAGAGYLILALRAWRRAARKEDARLFWYSLAYLMGVFVAITASARWIP